MSHIGELSAAAIAGFQVGRARRNPTPDDLYRFRSLALRSAFYRGVRRGRKATAHLETVGA